MAKEEYDEFLVNENFHEIKNSTNNVILFGSVGNEKQHASIKYAVAI